MPKRVCKTCGQSANYWVAGNFYCEQDKPELALASSDPKPTVTERGFQRHAPILSSYGGHVEVYESSAASGPHIWLRVESPADLNNPLGPSVEGIAHLTLEDATLLRDQLTQLIDNHYQVRNP